MRLQPQTMCVCGGAGGGGGVSLQKGHKAQIQVTPARGDPKDPEWMNGEVDGQLLSVSENTEHLCSADPEQTLRSSSLLLTQGPCRALQALIKSQKTATALLSIREM